MKTAYEATTDDGLVADLTARRYPNFDLGPAYASVVLLSMCILLQRSFGSDLENTPWMFYPDVQTLFLQES